MKDFSEMRKFDSESEFLEKAVNNPSWAKEKMIEPHGGGENEEGEDITVRFEGDIEKCLEKIRELDWESHVGGIYKNYKDKDKRKEFDPCNVRIYVNL